MEIKQFEDKELSHYSYAVLSNSEKKIVLIDPARNTQPYLHFAAEVNAQIIGVIETHPHADFVSSHLEFHKALGATIYTSKDVDASYPHQTFDEGQSINFGNIKLSSLNTPGHSPDGISILLEHHDKQKAVFTGDTLFIGDCGRPDLREGVGNIRLKREYLAKQMYRSLRDKLMVLNDDVIVYPAHGAGTLCGKNLSKESSSTIGQEKRTNWSLQDATEEEFVQNLLADQPFVPAYFSYDVELNRRGAASFNQSVSSVNFITDTSGEFISHLNQGLWIVDVRKEADFKQGHLPHSLNLMIEGKFETWLGSIIKPGEKYYLAGADEDELQTAIERAAAIGYESAITAAFVVRGGEQKEAELDTELFKRNPDTYTIVDVRNTSEVKSKKIFNNSISIPLAELRERVNEVPTDKPVVVHCAGGYRSAAASSLLHSELDGKVTVFDLSEAIKQF